ncbi:hypothetical protein [Arthrobacter sp. 35W]|nr:hypothetical protein [Arthrobacter sp. 35W]
MEIMTAPAMARQHRTTPAGCEGPTFSSLAKTTFPLGTPDAGDTK